MKAVIYHPNMHLKGGGETVALTIASEISKTHKVTIITSKKTEKKDLENYFGLNLEKVNFEKAGSFIYSFPTLHSLKQSLHLKFCFPKFKKYDLVIDTCTNGLFYKKTKPKTICYVHFPNYTLPKKGIKSILNSIIIKEHQMFKYDKIICNSKFTQSYVKKLTNKPTEIIYPPVKINIIKPKSKLKIITTIGRYSPEKKIEKLIEAFKDIENKIPEYEFHIVGAYNKSNAQYFKTLEKLAAGTKTTFHKNITHDQVLDLLEKSKIYWHSRGYGETDPVEFENFGITTVEAMAAGCIPIVINKGAQPEIVKDKKTGYLWNNLEELKKITIAATKQKTKKTEITLRPKEITKYESGDFTKKIREIINKCT